MRIGASLGENFACVIDYEDDGDDITDINVFSAATGQKLNDLIYGTSVWSEAWDTAERHLIYTPGAQAAQQSDLRSQCFDTPYAVR